jgi:hypothetical protein
MCTYREGISLPRPLDLQEASQFSPLVEEWGNNGVQHSCRPASFHSINPDVNCNSPWRQTNVKSSSNQIILMQLDIYGTSPWGHAGPCPLRPLTSLPPWCPGFLSLPFLSHPPRASDSLDHSSLRVGSLPNIPVHSFFLLFCRPAKPPPFQGHQNSCSCLLLVRSLIMWVPSDLILPHGRGHGNWGPLFHFPPASYTIRNFRPTDNSACHLLLRWYLTLLFLPGRWGDMFLRNAGWISTDYTALYPIR